jgi:hypothetical protein
LARWSFTYQNLYPTHLAWEGALAAVQFSHPKNTFAIKKNSKIWQNHFLNLKNQRKILTSSLLATAS